MSIFGICFILYFLKFSACRGFNCIVVSRVCHAKVHYFLHSVLCFSEEDNYACYARTLVKCFLAEGVASRHSLFLATAGEEPDEIWKVHVQYVVLLPSDALTVFP